VKDLTLSDLAERIDALTRLVGEVVRRSEEQAAVTSVVLARAGSDPLRVTVKEAVVLEKAHFGKGTEATVRRKIDLGIYHLEKRQGEREGTILIEEILGSGWQPFASYRAARRRQKEEERGPKA